MHDQFLLHKVLKSESRSSLHNNRLQTICVLASNSVIYNLSTICGVRFLKNLGLDAFLDADFQSPFIATILVICLVALLLLLSLVSVQVLSPWLSPLQFMAFEQTGYKEERKHHQFECLTVYKKNKS